MEFRELSGSEFTNLIRDYIQQERERMGPKDTAFAMFLFADLDNYLQQHDCTVVKRCNEEDS